MDLGKCLLAVLLLGVPPPLSSAIVKGSLLGPGGAACHHGTRNTLPFLPPKSRSLPEAESTDTGLG